MQLNIPRKIVCFSTEDMKDGINTFLEKRKANFEGK